MLTGDRGTDHEGEKELIVDSNMFSSFQFNQIHSGFTCDGRVTRKVNEMRLSA